MSFPAGKDRRPLAACRLAHELERILVERALPLQAYDQSRCLTIAYNDCAASVSASVRTNGRTSHEFTKRNAWLGRLIYDDLGLSTIWAYRQLGLV